MDNNLYTIRKKRNKIWILRAQLVESRITLNIENNLLARIHPEVIIGHGLALHTFENIVVNYQVCRFLYDFLVVSYFEKSEVRTGDLNRTPQHRAGTLSRLAVRLKWYLDTTEASHQMKPDSI